MTNAVLPKALLLALSIPVQLPGRALGLECGETVSGSTGGPGESVNLSFSADPGERILLIVRGELPQYPRATVSYRDVQGSRRILFSCVPAYLPYSWWAHPFQAPNLSPSGSYDVEISNPYAAVSFEIEFQRLTPDYACADTISCGTPVDVEIDRPGHVRVFRVDALEDNEEFFVGATPGLRPFLAVRDETGSQPAASLTHSLWWAFPRQGSYWIVCSGYQGDVGSSRLMFPSHDSLLGLWPRDLPRPAALRLHRGPPANLPRGEGVASLDVSG